MGFVAAEMWYLNPHFYIRELLECGERWVAWDDRYIDRNKVDVPSWLRASMPSSQEYRCLIVHDNYATELTREHGLDDPAAVYPVWTYTHDWEILEEVVAGNVGNDQELIDYSHDQGLPADSIPVKGQEHRVIVKGIPNVQQVTGQRVMRALGRLQKDNPHVIIQVHGSMSFQTLFGWGLAAATFDGRRDAQNGEIRLPTGAKALVNEVSVWKKWMTVVGMSPGDMNVPRNRCLFNIRSAKWASLHYDQPTAAIPIKIDENDDEINLTVPDLEYAIPAVQVPITLGPKRSKSPGDFFLCDACSKKGSCGAYRAGSVCSIPETEPIQMAEMFGTRNAETILDGMAAIVGAQAARFQRGMGTEIVEGELDNDVTRIGKIAFESAERLVKLLRPELARPGQVVNVGIIQGASQASQVPKPVAMGAAMQELEAAGIPRDAITEAMVLEKLGILVEEPVDV